MEKNDKVSVIIPAFNSEKFLIESVTSILNQTYQNIEIIVVDDGSTDNSLKILEPFSEKINIITQKNQGLASTLNTGIKHMTGRWFKWFSPDDVMNSDAIEILVKKGKEMGDDFIIYSNWEMIDEKGNFLRTFTESNYNDLSNFDFNVRLLDGQQINVNTSLIPTKLFVEGCEINDLEYPVAIDYDFFLKAGLLYKKNFYLIEKSLIKYRLHKNQLSHKNILKSFLYLEQIKSDKLSKLNSDLKKQYELSFKTYQKNQKISKKLTKLGLKFFSHLPDFMTDMTLIFYLNKIRQKR